MMDSAETSKQEKHEREVSTNHGVLQDEGNLSTAVKMEPTAETFSTTHVIEDVVYIKPDPDAAPGLSAETAIDLCNSRQKEDSIINIGRDSIVADKSSGDQSVKDELEQVKASLAALSKQLEKDRAENERLRAFAKRKAEEDVQDAQKHRKSEKDDDEADPEDKETGLKEEVEVKGEKEHENYLNQLFVTWNKPGQRFHLQPKQVKRAIQDALLTKERDQEFAIPNLNGYERHLVHSLCDSVGLEHESKGYGPHRVLQVSKPQQWTIRSINLESVSFAPKKPHMGRRVKKSHYGPRCGCSYDALEVAYKWCSYGYDSAIECAIGENLGLCERCMETLHEF